ncbi:hypothetical protein RHMOL_Rhmol04G0227800 [Rhododendron molle]|uniref:Uncharacterized protein n=1 Tax=Rhododendron molle TaxID=49168 RepID=A0ACC0P3N9_RHOML|nr:hypothetical protein RHMOL_Rhmol04G0227800 [Rhododendron molle]
MLWYEMPTHVDLVLASMAIHNYIRMDRESDNFFAPVSSAYEYAFKDLPYEDPELEDRLDERDDIVDEDNVPEMNDVRNNIRRALHRLRRRDDQTGIFPPIVGTPIVRGFRFLAPHLRRRTCNKSLGLWKPNDPPTIKLDILVCLASKLARGCHARVTASADVIDDPPDKAVMGHMARSALREDSSRCCVSSDERGLLGSPWCCVSGVGRELSVVCLRGRYGALGGMSRRSVRSPR